MKFKIETRDILKLVPVVESVPEAVARAEFRAVNKTTDKTVTMTRRRVVESVNLTNAYIKSGLKVTSATKDKPVALITAPRRPTKLYTYDARAVFAPAPKAKGNPRVGLPPGKKFAGVTVSVKRAGARKPVSGNAFLLPLLNNNGLGIFTREGGRLKHHYGPSVGQHFSLVIDDETDNIAADLEKTFLAQLDYELKR